MKVFVKAIEGVLVRHENGEPLAPEGENVELTSWWRRREADGDIELGEAQPDPESKATGKAK